MLIIPVSEVSAVAAVPSIPMPTTVPSVLLNADADKCVSV